MNLIRAWSFYILTYLFFLHAIPLMNIFFYEFIHKSYMEHSYIYRIDLPLEKKIKVLQAFEYFNSFTEGKSVKYSGYRPITIKERKLGKSEEGNQLLGQAVYFPNTCEITLHSEIDNDRQYRDVILHEYVHCFYIEHVDRFCDLMHDTLTLCRDEDNIKKYANMIRIMLNE